MLTKWLLFALIGAVGTGCVPEGEQGPFELTEEQVWKVVNRKHWGQDGIYVQATLRTFAYEIAQAYAQAEKEDLDQGQLESRLKQLVYEYASANYPAEDGTDINSIYIQYLVYVNPSFNVTNPLEKKGRDIGVSYIELDGDIAVIASGAGLGMASVDIINQKMSPANFLETGGAITEELLYKVTELVLQKEGVRGLFVNIYGGINPIHEGAKGIVRYLNEHDIKIPVVAKALGNHQEETWQIFRENGRYR